MFLLYSILIQTKVVLREVERFACALKSRRATKVKSEFTSLQGKPAILGSEIKMLFKFRFPILITIFLGIVFVFGAHPGKITEAGTVSEQILEYTGQNSSKTIHFTFEILGPTKSTNVDKITLFRFKLTNLSTSDEILDKEDINYIGISFEPSLKSEYVDKNDFLFSPRKISLAPGESYTGFFYYFDWSSEVPVGYVQKGELYITINGEEQRQPYQVTILNQTAQTALN
jgi:hypothetical protein